MWQFGIRKLIHPFVQKLFNIDEREPCKDEKYTKVIRMSTDLCNDCNTVVVTGNPTQDDNYPNEYFEWYHTITRLRIERLETKPYPKFTPKGAI